MSSNTTKTKGLDSDSGDSKSVSSRPEDDRKQPHMRWSDTSSTTNEPSSASATATVVSTAVARQPTSQLGLPTFATAATAADPTVPLSEQPRAGFGEQFLQKLRVMLDRESRHDSTTVQWSTDGNSFIITDQNQFEEHIIPTYFDNRIVFASFLRKLYRWGFKRVSNRREGHFEFGSTTFKRLDADSAPPAASAAAAVNTPSNDGESGRMQVQQQPTQAFSSLLQQVIAQTNQQPAHNPLPTSHADANAIIALLSSIQHQLSSQQPTVNHQSANNSLNMNLILQPFQQSQHPNPTLNLLDTIRYNSAGGQAPSSAQLLGHSISSSVHALMSLYGLLMPQPTLPNTIVSAAMTQPNNMAVQTLLTLLHRVGEEDRQRRAQADAILHAIISAIGLFEGGNNMIDETDSQRGLVAALAQTLGSIGEATTPSVPLVSVIGVPNNGFAHPPQGWSPSLSGSNLSIQADSIHGVTGRRDDADAAGQLEEDDHAQTQNGPENGGGNEDGNDGAGKVDRLLSQRKRKSRDDDDDQYDTKDDSWNNRLRTRKKSPDK